MLSYIEISQKNLLHNYYEFRKLLGPKIKITVVIKANAYGHGLREVAGVFDTVADMFAVDDIEEFRYLRLTSNKPTMVLGYVDHSDLEEAIRLQGIMTIYDIDRAKLINAIGKKTKTTLHINIKIDAGVGRQGVLLDDIQPFISALKKLKYVVVDGIYTHFSNIEEMGDLRHAKKQEAMFSRAHEIFVKNGYKNLQTHIASTAGAIVKGAGNYSMVRIGVGLFGMYPSRQVQEKANADGMNLKTTMRWITHIAQIKTVPANYSIGYGLTYRTTKPTKIAVIPQGYSDGYDRGLSNIGDVLIQGERCRILGRVAMNMFVVDVSHLDVVKCEDEVVLLGHQGDEEITAEEIADKIVTVNYEGTTRISPLLPRVIV